MDNLETLKQLTRDIIKEQSLIIGENLAKSRAENTGYVKFNSSKLDDLSISQENPKTIIEKLIDSYREIFGNASVEVCVDVIKRYPGFIASSFLPDKIKNKL